MDWTIAEEYSIPIGTHCHMSYPKEVSLVSLTLYLSPFTRKQLYRRLQQACTSGALRLVKRIHALLALAKDMSVQDVAAMLGLGEQTVRDYRNRFLVKHLASLTSKRPPGRPSKLTTAQRRELANMIKAGSQAAGSTAGCWNTPVIQDLIQRRFGVAYHPHSLATLLHHLGFPSQKARFVSAHLNGTKRLEWRHCKWPCIVRQARRRKALLLCGDEASFAQWGSRSSTWAPKGEQPEVPTSGKRKGYKVFGLIDSFSGQFFYKTHAGRFHSASYAAFLLDMLAQTRRHVVVIHDGARYHTSQTMPQFFNAHVTRLTMEQLPSYSPDFNPIEHLWKKVKKEATHLKYFPEFTHLQAEADRALLHFAHTPREITVLMARYCETLGAMAA
jgi:transposase